MAGPSTKQPPKKAAKDKSSVTKLHRDIVEGFQKLWHGPRRMTILSSINLISSSSYAKTEKGKRILKRLRELWQDKRLDFQYDDQPNRGGGYFAGSDRIEINRKFYKEERTDKEALASLLVHEGLHATEGNNGATFAEEARAFECQVEFYEARTQANSTYRDDQVDLDYLTLIHRKGRVEELLKQISAKKKSKPGSTLDAILQEMATEAAKSKHPVPRILLALAREVEEGRSGKKKKSKPPLVQDNFDRLHPIEIVNGKMQLKYKTLSEYAESSHAGQAGYH